MLPRSTPRQRPVRTFTQLNMTNTAVTLRTNKLSYQKEALPVASLGEQLNRQIIVILDFGSQYSELIARRIRETNVYSEVLSYRTTAQQLQQLHPQGIILSGGPNSVYDDGAPLCDPEIWNLR